MADKKSPVVLRLELEADKIKKDTGLLDSLSKQFKSIADAASAMTPAANSAQTAVRLFSQSATQGAQQTTNAFDKQKTSIEALAKANNTSFAKAAALFAKTQDLSGNIDKTVSNARKGFETLLPNAIDSTTDSIKDLTYNSELFKNVFQDVSIFDKFKKGAVELTLEIKRQRQQAIEDAAVASQSTGERPTPTGSRIIGSANQLLGRGQALFGGSTDIGNLFNVSGDILATTESIAKFRKELTPLALSLTKSAAAAIAAAGQGGVGGLASLGLSVGAVAAAAAIAAVAFAGFVVAFRQVSKEVSAGAKQLTIALSQQEQIQTIIATGTKEQAQEAIKAAEFQQKANERLKEQTKNAIEAAGGFDAVRKLAVLPGDFGGPFRQLLENYDKFNDQITANDIVINQLTNALNENTFAAQDAIDAELKLSEARASYIKEELTRDLEMARFKQSASADDVKRRLNDLKLEGDIVRDAIKKAETTNRNLIGVGRTETNTPEETAYLDLRDRLQAIIRDQSALGGSFLQLKESADKFKATVESTDYTEYLRKQQEYQTLVKEGNTQAVIDKRKQLEEESKIRDEELYRLSLLNTADISTEDYEVLMEQITKLEKEARNAANEINNLNNVLGAISLYNIINGIKNPVNAIKNIFTGFGIDLDKAASNISARLAQRNQELSDVYSRYQDDIKQIEENSLEQRAEIAKRYNDSIVEAAKDAVESASKALKNLEEQQRNISDSFNEGEGEAQKQIAKENIKLAINKQREERDALINHLRELERIRNNSAKQESALARDRDFAGIFALRENTKDELEQQQKSYDQSIADRAKAEEDARADRTNAIEEDRRARLEAYQKQLREARLAYDKELIQISEQRVERIRQAVLARDEALEQERITRKKTLDAKKRTLDQELLLIADFGVQAGKISGQKLKAALDYLASIQVGYKPPVRRASGGSLSSGQMSYVNDGYSGQQESFNGVPFPAGLGLFMPLQNGYVSNTTNNSSPSISMQFNVTGARSPELTAQAIQREVKMVIKQVLTKA